MNAVVGEAPAGRLLTVDDVLRMSEAGIVGPEERVELMDGELIQMPPINAPHMGHVNRLTRTRVRRVGDRGLVSVQNGLRVPELHLPQPDFVVPRPHPREYLDHLPPVRDIPLPVEVADSSLANDRKGRPPLYARRGGWCHGISATAAAGSSPGAPWPHRRLADHCGRTRVTPGCALAPREPVSCPDTRIAGVARRRLLRYPRNACGSAAGCACSCHGPRASAASRPAK